MELLFFFICYAVGMIAAFKILSFFFGAFIGDFFGKTLAVIVILIFTKYFVRDYMYILQLQF